MRTPAPIAFAALIALAACGDDPVVPGGPPGISFPRGANLSDTVDAVPVQALRVQVRGDDGRPAAHEIVRFEAVKGPLEQPEMQVAALSSRHFEAMMTDSTDEEGVVHVQVRMGRTAGTGRLLVTVPTLGLQDTARFEIRPGAAAALQGAATDAALPIGGMLALNMHVTDRYGNVRSDPVTYASSSPAVSVSGGVVTGRAFGNASVSASAGSLNAQVILQVVPVGSIAFNVYPDLSGKLSAIYTSHLDGSEVTLRAHTAAGAGSWPGPMTPTWLSATELIYSDEVTSHRPLHLLDLTTGTSRRFLAPGQQMQIEHHPQVTSEGNWLFFSGGTDRGYWLYRVRDNGEELQRISPVDAELSHWTPAPSPDGTRVAYTAQGAWEGGFEIMDLTTGQVRHIPVEGELPSWSPDGEQIAYLSGNDLRSVKPDGTGDRSLTAQPHRFSGRIGWSPDGAYLVTTVDFTRLGIIEFATGEVVSVKMLGDVTFASPVWRPEAP